MESCKPFLQTPNSSPVVPDPAKPDAPINGAAETATAKSPQVYVGFLDVFIHEARDIHNICIYHKQDVYAKLSLTTDPESAVSTQIINGGGRNPVFNQSLRLDVRTVDSSLKCEIWMLSRVRNYLEDQPLGFALVPLSDVVMANGKLVREFSLSSTDLFHSPAGFVQLSISYTGVSPEVLVVTPSPKGLAAKQDDVDSIVGDLKRIEFPDLNVVKENKLMVSEYVGVPCTNLDSETNEADNFPDEEAGVRVVECLATVSSPDGSVGALKKETPVSSFSTDGSLDQKDKSAVGDTESSEATADNVYVQPIIKINIEPEQSVVQQDIVDMYMKSMQQFTESLANMKLPMDLENSTTGTSSTSSSTTTTENGDSGSEKNLQAAKKTGSRVFYGSRAFF